MKKIKEILNNIKKDNITLVRFQWIGIDLLLRTMVTHSDYLESTIKSGIGITKAIQSLTPWDSLTSTDYGPESGEYKIIPDLNTFAVIPYTSNIARFICELCDSELKPADTDPRFLLRKVINQAKNLGYNPMVAFEAEFNIFKKVDDKIIPFEQYSSASLQTFNLLNPILQDWINSLYKMNVKVERVKKEGGEGQVELVIRYADALKAADDMATLRDVVRGVAHKHGYYVTFMPKVFRFSNGMHLHISLWDTEKKRNVFSDLADKNGLSKVGYYFIGGILKNIKALCALAAPLPTSYRRLQPGTWAPSHIYYGYDNRAAAIRIPSQTIPKRNEPTRIEYRLPDPTANPYLALTSTLAAGLEGIKNEIDPGDPINIDVAYLSKDEIQKYDVDRLPNTLIEAINELKKAKFLREILGENLLKVYVSNREAEWKAYVEHISEWEIKTYIDHY